jgi:hypothetical protein
MASEDLNEVEFRAVTRNRAFASFDRRDFTKSPVLIDVLQISAVEAEELAIANGRAAAELRHRCDTLQGELSHARLQHEQARGQLEMQIGVLRSEKISLDEKLREAYRQSAVAVGIAWLGTLLVALGVNLLTSGKNQNLGLLIVLAGAAVEASAFLVRRRVKPPAVDPPSAQERVRSPV